jgi:hypothetical protein
MKRSSGIVMVAVIGVAAFVAIGQLRADDPGNVAGYLQDVENFPNMLHTVPDCADVYSDFLSVAKQLQACKHLSDAKVGLAMEQSIAKQLGEIKHCKSCKKDMVKADEAAMAYNDNIAIYQPQCPSNQTKLLADYGQAVKKVCKKCHDKWPGKLGPQDKTPCN